MFAEDSLFSDEEDEEDEDQGMDKINKRRAQELRSVYLSACGRLGTAPVHYFYRHLIHPKLHIRHHQLGPKGAKACAIALVVSLYNYIQGHPVRNL